MTAYIALGTNMGERRDNIETAINSLKSLPMTSVTAVSKIYETAPIGFTAQDNFYNAVVKVETSLSAFTLLGACLGIEAAMGRIRGTVNGPRIIDLDLLLYENEKYDTKELILPHPRMCERAFVLYPLCDVLDDEKYKKLRDSIGDEGINIV